jgi:protein ImuA
MDGPSLGKRRTIPNFQERRMTGARMSTLASLRDAIRHLEAQTLPQQVERVALGHAGVDSTLQGGLLRGALHEVFATETRQSASATGFAAGMVQRLSNYRPMLWVQQDFAESEAGALSMSGFAELGLDPCRLVLVRVPNAETALKVTADGLACDALGAVVCELWGEMKTFDLTASRRLTLAAQSSGVSCVMLCTSSQPAASTAETRWVVRAARSLSGSAWSAWGEPMLDAELVRNRHGQRGRWIMEWNCDERIFREPAAHSQPLVAAPADRPHPTPAPAGGSVTHLRRVG